VQTLTFFRYEDFVDELRYRGLDSVRAEPIRSTRGGSQIGPTCTFQIVLTAFGPLSQEALACTIQTGQAPAVFLDNEPWLRENLDRAFDLVKQDLAAQGFDVRPGVFHHEEDGRATCGLWRLDKSDDGRITLVPVESEERTKCFGKRALEKTGNGLAGSR
jgi:hypothetical protein